MFEIGLLIALFMMSIFIGAGMYVGGLTAEWIITKIYLLRDKYK